MAETRQFLLLTITVLVLIVLSSCNSYQLFRDSSGISHVFCFDMKLSSECLVFPLRPIKYHTLNDPDRYVDRVRYKNSFFAFFFY